MAETSNAQHVLKSQANWDALYFYQKSDVIYQLAFAFCERFIHLYLKSATIIQYTIKGRFMSR